MKEAPPPWLDELEGGLVLRIQVIPNGSKTQIEGPHGNQLKIRLQAPPVEGKANQALLKFMKRILGCASSAVELVQGGKSRDKVVVVRGLNPAQMLEKLTKS